MKNITLLICLFTTLFSGLLFADNNKLNLTVSQAVMPKVPPTSRTAAIYLTIENHSEQALTLTDVSSDAAHHLMFHQTKEIDGVAKMQHQDSLTIPAKGQLVFESGGLHIMMMGLEHKLIAQPFHVKLVFEGGLEKTIKVKPIKRL